MRPVVIVLLEISSDAFSGLAETTIFRRPDFFLLQAAMEPFDVAVAFRMMISRAAMRDAESRQHLHEARRSKLRAIVCGQSQIALAAPCRQAVEHGLFHRIQCFLGATTMRKIPTHDLSCAAVDHTSKPILPPAPPRSGSCPIARSDSAVKLPRVPTLSFVWLASAASEPTSLALALPARLAYSSGRRHSR